MASERRVEYLDMDKLYPLAQSLNGYRAKATGEFRAPRKGEWFLSGAIIEAYRAFNDYNVAYPIARIYKVRKVEHWEIVDGS